MIYAVVWLITVMTPVQCTEPNVLGEPCLQQVVRAEAKLFQTKQEAETFQKEVKKLRPEKDFKVIELAQDKKK